MNIRTQRDKEIYKRDFEYFFKQPNGILDELSKDCIKLARDKGFYNCFIDSDFNITPETENIENTTNEIEDFQQDDHDEVECNQQEIEERRLNKTLRENDENASEHSSDVSDYSDDSDDKDDDYVPEKPPKSKKSSKRTHYIRTRKPQGAKAGIRYPIEHVQIVYSLSQLSSTTSSAIESTNDDYSD
ncbi:hypothetical protein M9Y10_022504 [Tritrichomonas musculus]|uniref:Uncharacterized protein n=1 Tax=Tritrichomonas musculus TaxID=1915356 RepID=A0ABR2KT11_9EUKA